MLPRAAATWLRSAPLGLELATAVVGARTEVHVDGLLRLHTRRELHDAREGDDALLALGLQHKGHETRERARSQQSEQGRAMGWDLERAVHDFS